MTSRYGAGDFQNDLAWGQKAEEVVKATFSRADSWETKVKDNPDDRFYLEGWQHVYSQSCQVRDRCPERDHWIDSGFKLSTASDACFVVGHTQEVKVLVPVAKLRTLIEHVDVHFRKDGITYTQTSDNPTRGVLVSFEGISVWCNNRLKFGAEHVGQKWSHHKHEPDPRQTTML